MVDKIVQGSIAARAVKSLLGLFAASMENSFIANRLPLFFKSIGSIKIRYAGLVIFIITILKWYFFDFFVHTSKEDKTNKKENFTNKDRKIKKRKLYMQFRKYRIKHYITYRE